MRRWTRSPSCGREAKAAGLAVVIWSYPRGGNLSKEGETAIDICAYAAHMAALLGAHIIKVKPPTAHLELEAAKKSLRGAEDRHLDLDRARPPRGAMLLRRRRVVVFSGGEAKDLDGVYDEVRGSATAAAPARSSAATPSSARRKGAQDAGHDHRHLSRESVSRMAQMGGGQTLASI